MTHTPPADLGSSLSERIRRARLLTCSQRRDLLAGFFNGAAADETPGLGLGTAIADFLHWEISSGRIRDGGGSPWWSAINGLLLLDMTAAARREPPEAASPAAIGSPGVVGWAELLDGVATGSTRSQSLLWSAHQGSIGWAAEICSGLLAEEPEPERDFARVALAVVDRAARMDVATDGPLLGEMTRSYFPRRYPIDGASLAELCAGLAELGSSATPRPAQSGSR